MSTSASLTGLRTERSKIAKSAYNLANNDTPGFKTTYYDLATLSNENGVRGFSSINMDTKGALNYTGIATDVAVDGKRGMFIAKDKISGEFVSLVTGSFRANADRQLEYLNKYLLMGLKYDANGENLPAYDLQNLTPIKISDAAKNGKVKSTDVKMNLSLNSGILAKGKSSFVVSPSLANRNTTIPFSGNLIPSNDLKKGDGFSITVKEETNGIINSYRVNCEFGGFINTGTLTDTATAISSGTQTDEMTINYNDKPIKVLRSAIAPTGTSDKDALSNLAGILQGNGLKATVISNSGISTLFISPQNARDKVSIADNKGNLASNLGILNQDVVPVSENTIRFGSMQDLADGLKKYFDIDSQSTSGSIIAETKSNMNVTFYNFDSARDTLKGFGLTSGPMANQGYDPYDYSINMASGKILPDMTQSTVLYDSLGGPFTITAALKRVSDGWVQELYTNETNLSSTSNGETNTLLQVTKFTFDIQGNLQSANSVQPILTSDSTITDPFAALNGNITVNGTNFSYSANPIGANEFSSLADLAAAINRVLSGSVQASINQSSNGIYQLKLSSPSGAAIATPTGSLATAMKFKIPDSLPSMNNPLTIKRLNSDRKEETMTIAFNTDSITMSEYKQMSGYMDANGRPDGHLTDISIEGDGRLVGLYDNGASINLYNIPLAAFKNQNRLDQEGGNNAFKTTASSGPMQIVAAGASGTGNISSGTIESSNTDSAEQLTSLIQSQQGYSLNAKSLSVSNSLSDILLKNLG